MAGVASHADVVAEVIRASESFGLEPSRSYSHGQRVWGAERVIDVLLYHPHSRERVGIECRYDGGSGAEAERVLTLTADVQTWVMRGLIVVAGEGFDPYMGMLRGKGLVIQLDELAEVLPLYFDARVPAGLRPTESDTPARRRAGPLSS